MPKSNKDIAAEVRAGGNLPGDMIFDPTKPADEMVRNKTAEEKRTDAELAAAAEETANEANAPRSGGANVE